ncbi:MAG TPA: plasmid pRiA4b ORF-3 family protein [Bryobacteraceae bacterium]|jgi:hypothetical protein
MPPAREYSPSDDIFQIKIALLGTQPLIWRRLLVPGTFPLRSLSDAIRASMGWSGSHLHEFRVGKEIYGEPDLDRDPFGITRRKDDRWVALHELLPRLRSKALYTYDFGDQWEHSITLEKRLKPDPEMLYPVCTGGAMAGPPEDSGGLPGYFALLEALQDPKHRQHEELLRWAGGAYDPNAFSITDVNGRLRRRKRRTRRH